MDLALTMNLIFQVIVVLLVVTGFIIAIIYLLGEYILKWRPWGKFSNLSDQIKYWSERVEECFKGFQILQDLFKDEDHTKVIQFMNHINFGYKKSDIRSKLIELETNYSKYEDVKNNTKLLESLKNDYTNVHQAYQNNPLERLVLKTQIIQYCMDENLAYNVLPYMFEGPISEKAQVYLRYFMLDFIIDYQKSFCTYHTVEYFSMHHDETTNFNIKQALRDVKRVVKLEAEKKEVNNKFLRNDVTRDEISTFLVSAFYGTIPFQDRKKLSIEEEQKTQELAHYSPKQENTFINEIKVEYISGLYEDNLLKLLGKDPSTDLIESKKSEIKNVIFKRIFVEVAKINDNVNYKIIENFLRLDKDKLKHDEQLSELAAFYEKERKKLNQDHCLENVAKNEKTEEELIAEIDFNNYHFKIEKKQEDKNYPIFKDLRSQLKEYEIMVTSLESSLGPGLLSVHYDELMQLFHTLIFIEEYDKNKGTINSVIDFPHEDKSKYYQIIRSLQEMSILISYDFPRLQYYDMNRECNVERRMIYYLDTFDRYGAYIEAILIMFVYSWEFYLPNKTFKHHKKLRLGIVNNFIDWVYSTRRSMHNIAKNPAGYIMKNFEWAMEGFTEQYEKFSNETYKNKNGDVIEHFGGLKKFFKGIMSFIKTLLMIIKIITDPIKVIKIIVVAIFSSVVILLSFIELLTNVYTGTLMLFSLIAFAFFYALYLYLTLSSTVVIALLELYLFSFNTNKSYFAYILYNLTASENDIRNWYQIPGFEQGNQVDYTILGHTGHCAANYEKELFYCKKNPEYLPTFSHQANVYKIANGLSTSGRMNMTGIRKTANFMKHSSQKKKQIIRQSNRTKRSFFNTSKKHFDKYPYIDRYIQTICSNPDEFDLSTNEKESLKQQCGQLFCKNGNYISSCVNVPSTELNVSSLLNAELKTINRYLNIVFSIVLILIIITFLAKKYASK